MQLQPFKAIYPNFDLISSADTFFATVKFEFQEYYKSGFFVQDETPGLFVYDIISSGMTHTGIVACVDIHDYLDGHIVKHEKTLATKEQQMMNLLLQRKAMIKPVLLGYPRQSAIDAVISEARKTPPFYSVRFEEEQQTHTFYKISSDSAIRDLIDIVGKHMPRAYIADGHHRCSTSAKLFKTVKHKKGQPDFRPLLCALFAFDELIIHDYNRVVEVLHEITPTVFMARLSRLCHLQPLRKASKPAEKHQMTMFLNREWYRLRWKKSVLQKYADRAVLLDAAILNKEVLQKILKIKDVRTDTRLRYVDGVAGVEGLVDKVNRSFYRIGFCLYPVAIEELVRVADADKTLPPKSTWFEPRVKNGLVAKAF